MNNVLRISIKTVVASSLFLISTMISISWAAEKLANPFGGFPPNYSPGEENLSNWQGILEGWERNFWIVSSNPIGKKQIRRTFVAHTANSPDKKFHCADEPKINLTDQGFTIFPSILGCWEKKDINSGIWESNLIDLGGYRHGRYDCKFIKKSKKVVQCVYTSAKDGKEYNIKMKNLGQF